MADGSGIAQAILGNQPVTQLQNPVDILTKWQQLRNMQASNELTQQSTKNAELANRTGEQSLATTMQKRNAQVLFGLSNLSDDEIGPAASKALDAQLQSGQIDEKQYGVLKQQVEAAGADPKKTRTMINGMLATTMAGPEAGKFLLGTPTRIDDGSNFSGAVEGGLGGQAPGALQQNGQVYQKSPEPGWHDVGGNLVATSGAKQLGDGLKKGLSPGESTQQFVQVVPDGKGGYDVVTQTKGQAFPSVAAPGTTNSGPLGGGNYLPPKTSMKMGTEQQVSDNIKAYQADVQQNGSLITGTQSLQKALKALNMVATGAGTEGVRRMRAYAQSLGNVLGIDTGGVNIQDMNSAQLEKYLTDYARQSSSAGRSDAGLEAAFKSNASGSINNSAAQDVVRTNIGRDRQKVAATLAGENAQDYGKAKTEFMTSTDPRGFAWDSYTEAQKQQIKKEVGPEGSAGYKKLAKAIGAAKKHNLYDPSFHLPDNVNQSPEAPGAGTVSPTPLPPAVRGPGA